MDASPILRSSVNIRISHVRNDIGACILTSLDITNAYALMPKKLDTKKISHEYCLLRYLLCFPIHRDPIAVMRLRGYATKLSWVWNISSASNELTK